MCNVSLCLSVMPDFPWPCPLSACGAASFFAMNTGIDSDIDQGRQLELMPDANDLPATSPMMLFMAAGFEAVAGWPLPCGRLPVAAKTLGMVSVTRSEWEEYRALCDAERPLLVA